MENKDDNSAGSQILTIVDEMDFLNLAEFLETIVNLTEAKQKTIELRKYFSHFRQAFQENYKTLDPAKANNDSIFSIVRVFLAKEDRKRSSYNLKGHTLGRLFAKCLGLDTNNADGRKLMNYKNPKESSRAGDLGNILFSVLEARCGSGDRKGPTIADIHGILDQLAKIPGKDVNLETQRKVLQTLLPRLSPLEGKWLARILLKELGLGVAKKQIFQCIHPQAEEFFTNTRNLETVCITFNDPRVKIGEASIQLFQPFQPMLCARLNSLENPESESTNDVASLPTPPFVIETKYDGERFQIHYDSSKPSGQRFKYFSRNSFDTPNFDITLSPRLEPLIQSSCDSFILDGEMMAYKKNQDKYYTGTGRCFTDKGANIDVKKMKLDNPNHCPAFVAYDLVFYNGESLISRPLTFRWEILKEKKLVIQEKDGVTYLSPHLIVQSVDEVTEALNDAIDNLEEGLVAKQLDSVYEIAKRSQFWLKIKPEFFSDHSITDLDLIIVGGYYSDTRRGSGNVTHFLVALLEKEQSGKELFYPVARLGSGRLRNPEIKALVNELKPNFREKEDPNFNVLFKGRKRPDFYINPKLSIVVQVKSTEILYHDNYALKYTLRFPRIVAIRKDKSWQDILTLKEFHDIRINCRGKLAKRNNTNSSSSARKLVRIGMGSLSEEKRREDTSPEKPSTSSSSAAAKSTKSPSGKYFVISSDYKLRSSKVVPKFSPLKSEKTPVKNENDIFNAKVFCVIGSPDWKGEIEGRIKLYGGKIVQNPTKDLYAIVAETLSVKVEHLIKRKEYDILKETWVNRCIDKKHVEKLVPKDLYSASPSTREELEKDFDIYGDSYRKKLSSIETRELLHKIIEEMDAEDANDSGLDESLDATGKSPLKRVLSELDPTSAAKLLKYNFLEECKIAFRGELCPQESVVYSETIKFYGGQYLEDEGDTGVTHVIAWEKESPTKKVQLSAFVVSPEWLEDCLKHRKLVDELNYMRE